MALRLCAVPQAACPPSRSAPLRCRAGRAECSSSGSPADGRGLQAGPQPASLAQRLAGTLQLAAAAVAHRQAAVSQRMQRLLAVAPGSSSSGWAASLLSMRQQMGGAALLAAVAVGPVGRAGGAGVWAELSSNYVFVVGFCGWFLAQFLKIFTTAYKTGVWDVRAFFNSGGMPSSHSALCTSVATAIGMQQGLGSPLFAVAVCFSVIVMYDAMGIRRHAGLQAEVLNIVAEEVLEGHPKAEQKLKEVLGHTPRQVAAGLLLGLLVGLLFPVF